MVPNEKLEDMDYYLSLNVVSKTKIDEEARIGGWMEKLTIRLVQF